jgi:hypothetical protein
LASIMILSGGFTLALYLRKNPPMQEKLHT